MPAHRPASYVRPVPTASTSHPSPDRPRPLPAIGRRALLGGTAAAFLAAAVGCGSGDDRPSSDPGPDDDTGGSAEKPSNSPLRWRGVNLDTDREVWRPDYVRREVATIADELHCNSVILLGHERGRLT